MTDKYSNSSINPDDQNNSPMSLGLGAVSSNCIDYCLELERLRLR